jgi:hypothetical protein
MGKPTLAVILAVTLSLILAEPALAADEADTFPATLGYAALAVAGTIFGGMAAAIRHLFKRLGDMSELHQDQIESMRESNQAQIDKLRDDHQKQIDMLRDRLELEQRERREESAGLLREQQDVMREVMTTCGAISQALTENTQALQALDSNVQILQTKIEEWGGEED